MPLAALVLFLLTGTLVPINRKFRETPGGIPVFVVSNGLHTDVVVPTQEPHTGLDWRPLLTAPGQPAPLAAYPFVAFGWGNADFYRNSRGGHTPGVGTTLRAALPSPTLLHVSWWAGPPQPGTRVAALHISAAQYQTLAATIQASFQTDSAGRFVPAALPGYTLHDRFFAAYGRYYILRTCNDWTNRVLRRAGLRAALKAPLAGSVLYQVQHAHKATSK
ncbi:TIGR02117 family protein [Hymenobacter sp. BT507]|uniref:TIGR02117 family protein n=1 Tax=Hymenobacter citatus TaxID=2763506 RepID=A0ABR7ME81_9BACT|nr:TIGR02117 family protein [Hymenobacter citatus]MBC6609391.1 TIGR02117 family protein [Hymenobacter citatus]